MSRHDTSTSAIDIVVFGVVQGVGFRPFIYRLAKKFNFNGWVKNIGFGVEIHLETDTKTDFKEFLKDLEEKKPPLSQLEEVTVKPSTFRGLESFQIKKTTITTAIIANAGSNNFLSPKVTVISFDVMAFLLGISLSVVGIFFLIFSSSILTFFAL